MKNLKVNLFMVAAMVIATVTMSFKIATESDVQLEDEKWFEYTNATLDNDISNPQNYVLVGNGSLPPFCIEGEDQICAVKAVPQPGGIHPDMDTIIDDRYRAEQ